MEEAAGESLRSRGYSGSCSRAQQSPSTGGKLRERSQAWKVRSGVRNALPAEHHSLWAARSLQGQATRSKGCGEGKSRGPESIWETATSHHHLHFLCEAKKDRLLLGLQETVEILVKQHSLEERVTAPSSSCMIPDSLAFLWSLFWKAGTRKVSPIILHPLYGHREHHMR